MLRAQNQSGLLLSIPRRVDNYVLGQIIGEGMTCVVVAARDRSSGKEYAVKVMSSSNLQQTNMRDKVDQEISIIRELNHEHIVRFHEEFTQNDLIFQLIEKEQIKDQRTLKILQVVQYLHRKGIAHNDIKPENIALDSEGNIRLIDFGLAKRSEIAGDGDKSGTLFYSLLNFWVPDRTGLKKLIFGRSVSFSTQWQRPSCRISSKVIFRSGN
jgi:serine/threonine protein kinase